MHTQNADFYLNLDRWGLLSRVERDRGRWEARMGAPASRLDNLRREAIVQATQGIQEGNPPARLREAVLSEKPLEDVDEMTMATWRYGRSVLFVNGWYPALSWTPEGMEQILRVLGNPGDAVTEDDVSRLLVRRLQAALVGRQTGGSSILEFSVFYGSFGCSILDNKTYLHLYLLALRLLLLQKGYLQILFAPIEEAAIASLRRRPPEDREGNQPEERLGEWLDDATALLIQAGRSAEENWKAAQIESPRSDLQETILGLVHRHGKVTAGDVLRSTQASRNTVKDNLARMVEEGVLLKRGRKRGTIYTLA